MPSIETCSRCSAPFVTDECAHARKELLPRCEACSREELDKTLARNREWLYRTGGVSIAFLAWSAVARARIVRRNDAVPWEALLGVGIASGFMAAFFYFRRVRPRLRQQLANLAIDRERGSSSDRWRLRRLEELGHAGDLLKEQKAQRVRRESLTARAVAEGRESALVLREERRRNRLLDQIDEVNEEIRVVKGEARTDAASPALLAGLERRLALLTWAMEHPPVWPRVVGSLMTQVFCALVLLPVTALAGKCVIFGWRAGNVTSIAIIVAIVLAALLLFPEEFQPEWLKMIRRRSRSEPAKDAVDEAVTE